MAETAAEKTLPAKIKAKRGVGGFFDSHYFEPDHFLVEVKVAQAVKIKRDV